jgi:ribonuclease D
MEVLADMKGISPRLAQGNGGDLLRRLEAVDRMPDEELLPYPRFRNDGPGRPTPEEEALAARIRDLRTEKAGELEVDRGVLLSNAQIMEIVRRLPGTLEELHAIPGIRQWQARIIGTDILRLVEKGR